MNKIVKLVISFLLFVTALGLVSGESQVSAAQFFIKPSAGTYTSNFGPRSGGYHYGIDIATSASNTAVNSSAAGVVRTAVGGCSNNGSYGNTCNGGFGNYIIVRHNANGQIFDTLYAHLSNISVSVNQNVAQGQRIGTMGNSGSSTGQHLHFELHPGGRVGSSSAVNPRPYIDGTINPAPPATNYHEYDGTWAVVKIKNPTGGSTANLFEHVGYGIKGTLPVGNTYKVYANKVYAADGTLYYNVGPGYIHNAYGELNNHHAVVSGTITTYNSPNGTVNRSLAAGTYRVHAARDGWYDLGASTWVKANQIKVIKNP